MTTIETLKSKLDPKDHWCRIFLELCDMGYDTYNAAIDALDFLDGGWNFAGYKGDAPFYEHPLGFESFDPCDFSFPDEPAITEDNKTSSNIEWKGFKFTVHVNKYIEDI